MSNHTIPPQFLQINYTNCNDYEVDHNRLLPFQNSDVFRSKIKNVTVLTKGDDVNTVYSFSLDVEAFDYKYEPGDTIGILPNNNEEEINQIFRLLAIESLTEKVYELNILKDTEKKKPIIPVHIPKKCTLRTLFKKHVDIRCPPKKLFLKMLLSYTTDEQELELLNSLCSTENSHEYAKFINKQGRSLLGTLQMFPNCKVPIERLLEFLPPLHPRPYSIASSPLMSSKHIDVVFSVINIDGNIKGVCTGWLEENFKTSSNSFEVSFYFRKPNTFRLPEDVSLPKILIATGTGIAPYMGFLQHLQYVQMSNKSNENGPIVLFYGCRYSDKDFIFKKEIYDHLNSGLIHKLFISFSRETDKKIYVQDNIIKYSSEIVNKIMNENAIIYVCGNAKVMTTDVKNAIMSSIAKHSNLETKAAEDYVTNMMKNCKYIQDVWS